MEVKPLQKRGGAGRFNRGAGRFQAKPSARSSENAPQSLIGAFLARDIPNIVFEGKNAIAGPQTALKRKPIPGGNSGAYRQKAKPVASTEGPGAFRQSLQETHKKRL